MIKLLHSKPYLKKILFLFLLGMSTTLLSAHGYDFFEQERMVKVVKCYPNPANSFINFEFDKSVDKEAVLLVYSFTGKKMLELSTTNTKTTVQLDNFFRGLYLYQLKDKAGHLLESGKFQVIK